LAQDKTNLEALSLRGQAYYGLGEHDTALTHWREGLRLAPEHTKMKEIYTVCDISPCSDRDGCVVTHIYDNMRRSYRNYD
jgi:tetratricopeptide (TPR) repeat protein